MHLILPPLRSLDRKFLQGQVLHLACPSRSTSGTVIRFTVPSASGVRFSPDNGTPAIYIFPKQPKPEHWPTDGHIIIGPALTVEDTMANLANARWVSHTLLDDLNPRSARNASLASWRNAFRYVDEDSVEEQEIGLRRPQLGALHAIHAHWSTDKRVATVVMPTGTGKTETMLAALTSAMCDRVLVLVPTDALRTQISEKFVTLGVLKDDRSVILRSSAERPVVGTLTKIPKTIEAVDEMFSLCNVVVTTSALAGACEPAIQEKMAEMCSHLFVDEAHHAEAPSWKSFKSNFRAKKILQFTATPFREDGQPLDGKIIYVYSLRQAQAEGYFRPIRFSGIYSFNSKRADSAIAAKVLEELRSDKTGKHVAMARVSNTLRAADVFELYRELGEFNPVILHSKMPRGELSEAKEKLLSGQSRIVVCVDMLGEGFDMPELKIAAFHDVRKSLSVTLQLAGRFTRARPDLGDPVFIANTADVNLKDELRSLYSQDPDWNILLPDLSDGAIGDELDAQQFLAGFRGELEEIPLSELHPAASMVVFRTLCANWNPNAFRKGFRGLSINDRVYPILNEKETTLVVLAARRQGVPWTSLATVEGIVWELLIAVWDRELSMLFIHGSTNTGAYSELAKALCGEDATLVVDPAVFRAFHGINRLVLMNVGLNEHMGRQIRYTGRMGADVGSRLSDTTLGTARKAVLGGVGFENGAQTSIGAGKRGRVWSNLRLRVNTFAIWCRGVGAKLANEEIDPDAVLAGTLIPKIVETRPTQVAIGVDWPELLLDHSEATTAIGFSEAREEFMTMVGIEIVDLSPASQLILRIFTNAEEVTVRLEFVGTGTEADFRYVYHGQSRATIRRGSTTDLCEFLTENPPTIWFADGSCLEGNQHTELRTQSSLYNIDYLDARDWSGVDPKKESQGEERRSDSIQFRIIGWLKEAGGYEVIFDDDGAGEAADVVAIHVDDATKPKKITVDLYHCKYSMAQAAGGRVDDLYVVCGQSQRSVMWLHNRNRRTDLFVHLLKRDLARVESGRPTRFEFGNIERLAQLRDASRSCEVTLRVFLVQPGLAKSKVSPAQLALLGVTQRFLYETYQIPFKVICHP